MYLSKVEIFCKGKLIFVSVFIIVGMLFSNVYDYSRITELNNYIGKQVEVVGTICNEGIDKTKYWQYLIRDVKINGKKVKSNILIKSKSKFSYGEEIKFLSLIEEPSEIRNEGGFNYLTYLKTIDVYSITEVKSASILQRNNVLLIENLSYIIRNRVKEFTNNMLDEKEAGILNALIIGDESKISSSLEESYKKAGMIHLLVVSGGHTVFLVMLLKKLCALIKVSKNLSKVIYIIVIFTYIFITGATPSILRAGIAIILVIISDLIGRQNDGLTTVFFVALLIILHNPNIIFSLSFQLSFGGALGIMLGYPVVSKFLSKLPKVIMEPLGLTIAAQLFVTPITLYNFNIMYWGGIVSNIFTLSLSGYIMMFGMILFIIYLFFPFIVLLPMKVVYFLISLMNYIAKIFSSIDWLVSYVPSPNIFSIVLYYIILIYICIKSQNTSIVDNNALIISQNVLLYKIYGNIKRNFVVYGVIIILILNLVKIDVNKELKVSVIDVGHGDSILITTPSNRYILIDTGDEYEFNGSNFDAGRDVIVPYLLKKGITKIDFLVLTHLDSDHIGGFESISKAISIENLFISINSSKKDAYKKIRDISVDKLINIKMLERGDTFKIDDINIKVLMPQKVHEIYSENNDSIVLLMEYLNRKLLFMGDLEEEGEEILMKLEKNLDVDIIKIGHHGSITSSTEEFISKTKPKIALISVGNRFSSIPSKQVLKRLSSVYSKVYRTDENGEITVTIDENKIEVNTIY